jgi:hypothetical protein
MNRFDYLVLALQNSGIKCDIREAADCSKAAVAFISSLRTRFQLIARFDKDNDLLCIHCLSSCRVPTGALADAAQLANRINPYLKLGSLCVDTDSDLIFKASSYVTDETIDTVVKQLTAGAAVTLDTFEPAFNSQIYANASVEEAFQNAVR